MNKEEAKNLLPWYAVGALDADEARAVKAHLEGSAELKQELAELRVLHRTVSEVTDDEPVFRPTLINDALRRIDDYEATRAPQGDSAGTSIVDWLRQTLVGGWLGSPAGARVAMVAQFGLILVLGGVLLSPMLIGSPDGRVMGGKDAAPTGSIEIAVTFRPNATEQGIRELLADVNGEIVAGPSAQGAYTILLGTTARDVAARQLEQMRNAEIVRHAGERSN